MNLKNKRGSESLISTKLIVLILVVLVVLTILIFAFRSDTLNWIKNLPGFKEPVDREVDLTTLSPDELANIGYTCTKKTDKKIMIVGNQYYGGAISQIITENYREIYLFSDKGDSLTKPGLLVRETGGGNYDLVYSRTSDIILGKVVSRRLTIDDSVFKAWKENDVDFDSSNSIEIRKQIALELANRLNNAYSVANSLFCKGSEELEYESRKNSCELLKCSLVLGECKQSGTSEEIDRGKLDCSVGSCFVKISQEKLVDENLKIGYFDLIDSQSLIKPLDILIDSLQKNVLVGTQLKINYAADSKADYCYSVATNKETFVQEYYNPGQKTNQPNLIINPDGNIKFVEFLVWEPWNSKFVLKRIGLNYLLNVDQTQIQSSIQNQMGAGKYISDTDFKKELIAGGYGGRFIILSSGQPGFYSAYSAIKTKGDRVQLYVWYKSSKDILGERWHELDCNWWYGSTTASLSDIQDSLTKTIEALKCTIK